MSGDSKTGEKGVRTHASRRKGPPTSSHFHPLIRSPQSTDYLILAYTDSDKVALNVSFYYMANAGGRLIGTILSGPVYQVAGLVGCLVVSTLFVVVTGVISLALPAEMAPRTRPFALGEGGE